VAHLAPAVTAAANNQHYFSPGLRQIIEQANLEQL
jgi:hypothetical protein